MALIAFLYLKAALTLCNHSPLERFPQCLIIFADNVCARDLTIRGVCGRNGQRARGECAEQLHSPLDILLLATVIKDEVNTVLREADCSILWTD